jgi:hypothetical protein
LRGAADDIAAGIEDQVVAGDDIAVPDPEIELRG